MNSPLPLQPLLNSALEARIERVSTFDYRGVQGTRFELKTAQNRIETYDVLLVKSPGRKSTGNILEITGWEPNLRDVRWAQRLAGASGHDVAVLFNVPNQPIRGLQEDGLLADSVVQFMESGNPADLTHTSMVASVLAVVNHFEKPTVLTGASKRGWTSWLAGFSGHALIRGVVPRVFDHIDFRLQLARQRELWGRTSPMIEDYNEADLISPVDDPAFDPVLDLLDPVRSWHGMEVPALAIAGTNDPFWTPDAWHLVADRRPELVELLYCPNVGHGLADEKFYMPSLAEFSSKHLTGRQQEPTPAKVRRWVATSPTPWTHRAHWRPIADESISEPEPTNRWVSWMDEFRNGDTRRTSPVRLISPA